MALADWTVLVFLNGDNNLEADGVRDFGEMAKVGSTENVNVVVQFDRNGGYATTSPQWKGAARFKIERGMRPDPADAVEVLGDTNMGSGTTLRQFVDWGRQNYPAKRVMLDIWNHGQGWRITRARKPDVAGLDLNRFLDFRVTQSQRESARHAEGLSRTDRVPAVRHQAIPIDMTVNGAVRSVSNDDTSGSVLYNRAIQDSLAGIDLDLIGFDACLMAMVETGYALRERAKVMVASQDLEPGTGWDYEDWLTALVKAPDMEARDLGALLVDSYKRTYTGEDESTTLSAVDLAKINTLAEKIDTFADKLSAVDRSGFEAILAARGECDVFAPGYGLHGIDLSHFATKVAAKIGDAGVKSAARDVEKAVSAAVISNFAGAYRSGDGFGSKGLAIYFPENEALFRSDPDYEGYIKTNTTHPVQFVQNHRWADFLLTKYLPNT